MGRSFDEQIVSNGSPGASLGLARPGTNGRGEPPLLEPGPTSHKKRRGTKLISAEDVLGGNLGPELAVDLDTRYGNADLIRAMRLLGMAGPFRPVSPWELEDQDGHRRIDASGYSALPFGAGSPQLTEFLGQYLQHNQDVPLPLQSASRWRAALAHNLIRLLQEFAPSHADSEVHFSTSGSEAVENAIKFVRAGRPRARYLVNFQNAYHGHTLMALSLTPNHAYQDLFRPMAPDVVTLPFGELRPLERAVEGLGPENVAAVVLEPIQGEGGVIIPPDGYLRAVGELCRRYGILVVADEVQTGLGRTGHYFESLAQGLEPDILVLGKHLSGGMAPIGVTIARRRLCRIAVGGTGCDRLAGTYSGNSLSVAVALKSLDLLVEQDLPARAQALGKRGLQRLQQIQARYPGLVEQVRGAGVLFALQLKPVLASGLLGSQAEAVGELTSLLALSVLHQAGVHANMAMNARRVVRLSPALTIPEDLFDKMWDRVEQAADSSSPAWRLAAHSHLRTLLGLSGLALATHRQGLAPPGP